MMPFAVSQGCNPPGYVDAYGMAGYLLWTSNSAGTKYFTGSCTSDDYNTGQQYNFHNMMTEVPVTSSQLMDFCYNNIGGGLGRGQPATIHSQDDNEAVIQWMQQYGDLRPGESLAFGGWIEGDNQVHWTDNYYGQIINGTGYHNFAAGHPWSNDETFLTINQDGTWNQATNQPTYGLCGLCSYDCSDVQLPYACTAVDSDGLCTTCAEGFYLPDMYNNEGVFECVQCTEGCKSCSQNQYGDQNCSSCYPGYGLGYGHYTYNSNVCGCQRMYNNLCGSEYLFTDASIGKPGCYGDPALCDIDANTLTVY